MNFCLFSLKWPLFLAAAVLTAGFSIEAQPSNTGAGQSIIFSSPDNTEISSNLTLHPAQSSSSSFQNKLRLFQDQSPVANFNNLPTRPAPMPAFGRRLIISPHRNQDWEFMTPAEIMGVPPDQLPQSQESDANGDQDSLTPMERYLERQNTPARPKPKSSDNLYASQNFWGNESGGTNSSSLHLIDSSLGNLSSTINFNQTLKSVLDADLFASQNGESNWSKLFGLPAAQPAPNPVQPQSDMKEFMQLLNPGSASATTATASPDETTSFKAQTALTDSDPTEPLPNPLGASFVPLQSGIGKPAALAPPLPSITRQASLQPVTPPAWAPQSPPWLSPTPQPFAIPQRKF